jgi:hypothetical protein
MNVPNEFVNLPKESLIAQSQTVKVNVKVTFNLEQATKAQKGK